MPIELENFLLEFPIAETRLGPDTHDRTAGRRRGTWRWWAALAAPSRSGTMSSTGEAMPELEKQKLLERAAKYPVVLQSVSPELRDEIKGTVVDISILR